MAQKEIKRNQFGKGTKRNIRDQRNDCMPYNFAFLVVQAHKCMKFGTLPPH
jgi:hypothetical protein